MTDFSFDTYLSPFTWRYGSGAMRKIWSERNKRRTWREVWIALVKAQQSMGLMTQEEVDDLLKNIDNIDIEKAHELEKDLKHDLMAELKVFAEQSKIGGGKLHLGATSMDIEDNADAIRIQQSLDLVLEKTRKLLLEFGEKIEKYKDLVCMGYTHLQPAEPTTLGYRFSFYAQDLMTDLAFLKFAKSVVKGKGMKGAVGTYASYAKLSGKDEVAQMEQDVMESLGVSAYVVANQTGPRKSEYITASALSSLSQTLYKFAFDIRLIQQPSIGEWQEPFGEKQVGSSAMPFKRNPIKSEQTCSLARIVFALVDVLQQNAAHMLLERTLDDSANRRVVLPELFLTIDAMLDNALILVTDLRINTNAIEQNLEKYGPFAATEEIMMLATKNGANRQEIHETLRELSMQAWQEVQNNKENPLSTLIAKDNRITKFINATEIEKTVNPKEHIGLAVEKCEEILREVKKLV